MEIKIKFPILIPHFQDFRFSTTMGGLLSSPSWSPSTPVTTTAEADPARADMDKKTTNDNTHQSIKPGDHVCCKGEEDAREEDKGGEDRGEERDDGDDDRRGDDPLSTLLLSSMFRRKC